MIFPKNQSVPINHINFATNWPLDKTSLVKFCEDYFICYWNFIHLSTCLRPLQSKAEVCADSRGG